MCILGIDCALHVLPWQGILRILLGL